MTLYVVTHGERSEGKSVYLITKDWEEAVAYITKRFEHQFPAEDGRWTELSSGQSVYVFEWGLREIDQTTLIRVEV